MISFISDYTEGAHPEILRRLTETNLVQTSGYGTDPYTLSAIGKIRAATQCPEANVVFLVGGTQANSTIIDALLPHHGAVVSASTGHIALHEGGAVELFGHKVVTLPSHEGKLAPDELANHLRLFYEDPTWPHQTIPGMVYVSHPTEYGTLYNHDELAAIHETCRQYGMKLFVDGARLGYALASLETDITLPQLSRLCDVFYIGGTKVGAFCGEAVVFPQGDAPRHLFTIVKQHGALLAKGRLLGVQFDTLFTDDLYLRISRHAIDMAMELRRVFERKGIPLHITSPTNQQFPILDEEHVRLLSGKVLYEHWERLSDGRHVSRFATSWATPVEHVRLLEALL